MITCFEKVILLLKSRFSSLSNCIIFTLTLCIRDLKLDKYVDGFTFLLFLRYEISFSLFLVTHTITPVSRSVYLSVLIQVISKAACFLNRPQSLMWFFFICKIKCNNIKFISRFFKSEIKCLIDPPCFVTS